jgi:hypothetical protein
MTDHPRAPAAGGGRPMPELSPRLIAIGDDLERAARADLAAARRSRRVRRRILGGAAALAILAPGAALAGGLLSSEEVARSLPAGTKFLVGTHPTCEVVHDGVEYHCTIDQAPQAEVSDLKDTVEPTVDATKHVNGGCRSLRSDGTEWQCYIGRAAVDQKIVGAGLLGRYAPEPGVG